jgi:response regulator RpfG family c-di-GMP phosphodiesterase
MSTLQAEATRAGENNLLPPWRVLVVDDEPDVHAITRLVLRDTIFENRPVEFLNAYSGAEAREILENDHTIAAAIIDVVMETDDAGLKLAKWIREDLRNHLVRIILRTGRPGEAPERSVILRYDINDYREKSELTDVRLLTMLVSALRGYRDLHMLELSRRGFERIAAASGQLFRNRSIHEFMSGVLVQLSSLIAGGEHSVMIDTSGIGVKGEEDPVVVAATGRYEALIGKRLSEIKDHPEIVELIQEARQSRAPLYRNHHFAGYYRSVDDSDMVLVLQTGASLGTDERSVLEAFSANVSLAFENLTLSQQVESSQREMIYMLGDAVETRSMETGDHVRRMTSLVGFLARKSGVAEQLAHQLQIASSLHDIGKLAIPDRILKKPGPLSDDEMDEMKDHATIGYNFLKDQRDRLLRLGAEICYTHHERWQGQGYPRGLKGADIPLSGRIVALADVMDALSHTRVYKEAWGLDDVIEHVKQGAGVLYDPDLAKICIENEDEIRRILTSA